MYIANTTRILCDTFSLGNLEVADIRYILYQ